MANLIPWRNKQSSGEPAEYLPLNRLRTEMDRLFDTFLREPLGALDWPIFGRGAWVPPIDVSEGDEEVTVRAELPGIDPQDLDVRVVGNTLTLSGEKKESTERKEKGFYRSESRYGSFQRNISLPQAVDPNQVDAQYANGVLTLRLKKSPEAMPKRIQVQVKN